MKNTLIIYHGYCTDGLAAAVSHRLTYERRQPLNPNDPGPESALDTFDYLAMTHKRLEEEDKFFENVDGYKDVWFLDFCPTEPLLRKMLDSGQNVTILDHHKSSYEMIREKFAEVNNQLRVIFSIDNKLSGATLTWLIGLSGFSANLNTKLREVTIHDHKFLTNVNIGFIKEDTLNFKDPLYNLIGIRDIWDESNPAMKQKADALHAYFDYKGLRDFDKFYQFVKREEFVFHGSSIIDIGETILAINKRNCEEALKDAHQSTIETKEGPIEFCIGLAPSGQGSQFGQSWSELHPGKKTIAIAIFMNFDKATVTLGFRSRNIDALRLVETFPGGGGHPNACGCRITNHQIVLPFEPNSEDGYVNTHTMRTPAEFIQGLCVMMQRRIEKVYGKVIHETSTSLDVWNKHIDKHHFRMQDRKMVETFGPLSLGFYLVEKVDFETLEDGVYRVEDGQLVKCDYTLKQLKS